MVQDRDSKNRCKHSRKQRCFSHLLVGRIWEQWLSKKLRTCRWRLLCNRERLIVPNRLRYKECQWAIKDIIQTKGTNMEFKDIGVNSNNNAHQVMVQAWLTEMKDNNFMMSHLKMEMIQTSGSSAKIRKDRKGQNQRRNRVDSFHSYHAARQRKLKKLQNLKRKETNRKEDHHSRADNQSTSIAIAITMKHSSSNVHKLIDRAILRQVRDKGNNNNKTDSRIMMTNTDTRYWFRMGNN